jgi:hypothetical protein
MLLQKKPIVKKYYRLSDYYREIFIQLNLFHDIV